MSKKERKEVIEEMAEEWSMSFPNNSILKEGKIKRGGA